MRSFWHCKNKTLYLQIEEKIVKIYKLYYSMEKENKKMLDDFVQHFDVSEILDALELEISEIKHRFSDEELIWAMDDVTNALEEMSDVEIIEYLENNRDYKVYDKEKCETIEKTIERICRELKPRGYIDKEEAKRLICEYIDNTMTRAIE